MADTESWEQKVAQTLEDMDEVFAYVKNQNLGFTIPYTLNGEEHNYHPDFIAVIEQPTRPVPNAVAANGAFCRRQSERARVGGVEPEFGDEPIATARELDVAFA